MTPKTLFDRENWEPMWDVENSRWHNDLRIGTVCYFIDGNVCYFGRICGIYRTKIDVQVVGNYGASVYYPSSHERGVMLVGSEHYAPDPDITYTRYSDLYSFMRDVLRTGSGGDVREDFHTEVYGRPIVRMHHSSLYNYLWWLHTARVAPNPRDGILVPTAPESYDSVFVLMSWHDYCYTLGTIGALWDEEEVTSLLELINNYVNPQPVKYQWNIINGSDIRRVYAEQEFGSCLYNRTDMTEFFVRNSERVAMVTLRDNRERLKGRALLWWCDEGEIFLDRIYPVDDNSFITAMFKELAEEQGWFMRKKQSVRGRDYGPVPITCPHPLSVTLDNHSSNGYPFMDTFVYVERDADEALTQFTNHCIKLRTNQPDEPFLCLRNLNGGMVLEGDDSGELERILTRQRLGFVFGKYVRQHDDDRLSAFIYAPERLYSVLSYTSVRPTFAEPFNGIDPQPLSDYLLSFVLGTGESNGTTFQEQVQVADTQAFDAIWTEEELGF